MIVTGIDIGSRSAQAVILKDNEILTYSSIETGPESAKTAGNAMDEALKGTNFTLKDIDYIVATGYGRVIVPFAQENITEIACHARGAHWYFSLGRTILDMGGQDCKVIRGNEKGEVTNFVMNDKCAGGTGRFFELVADVLDVPLQHIGELSLESSKKIVFSSVCAVFAKTEAISLFRRGAEKSDILEGLHEAVSRRVVALMQRVGIEEDFIITGGIAKNVGMVKKIEKKTGIRAFIPPEPQIIGALGAALFAREKASACIEVKERK